MKLTKAPQPSGEWARIRFEPFAEVSFIRQRGNYVTFFERKARLEEADGSCYSILVKPSNMPEQPVANFLHVLALGNARVTQIAVQEIRRIPQATGEQNFIGLTLLYLRL